MEPISLRAYARHRAAKGLPGNAMAVSLAVKAGRLVKSVTTVNGQPKITDPELADQEWDRNTDAQKRVNAAGGVEPVRAILPPALVDAAQRAAVLTPAPPEADIDGPDYGFDEPEKAESVATATERLKSAQADLAELKRDEARGELVPTRDVERRLIEVFSAAKTRLLAIPSRARQALPHLSNADVAVIEDLVREACTDLAGGKA